MDLITNLRDAQALLEDLTVNHNDAGNTTDDIAARTSLVKTLAHPEVIRVLIHQLEDAVNQLEHASGRIDSTDEPGAIHYAHALAITLLRRGTIDG
ncbi:hypothetical protein [Curtobacterium sp. MCSS17_016]|uniref:hypothetical protein n=1 Tax=Curtobacterium sp. MCSS17_016 TaxID=2175644 RepID=UPI000DA8CC27|nr:hypothetical protein [Curtobacterium sp. MCSS17_016]WIE81329.1 hypothetical protein DEJ19_019030 [Curtobacterium sp. MCSS17_016]